MGVRPIRLALLASLAGCTEPPAERDPDRGPIESGLGEQERSAWPGGSDPDGPVVPIQNGFFDGRPAASWSFGLAGRDTADSFWFCREQDAGCPLDSSRRLDWDRAVGLPLVSRVPAMEGYSPYWQVWVVRVAPEYVANSVKSTGTLHEMAEEGELSVEPLVAYFPDTEGRPPRPEEVVVHFPLVLDGTVLENNGASLLRDPSRTSMFMETRQAWHEGRLVNLIDFSRSEGVFPEADDSDSRPRMPFGEVFELFRACAGPDPELCETVAVSEPRLGRDLTGDGDMHDTNDVFSALPCTVARMADRPYSPLRKTREVEVDPSVDLIDRSGDEARSDVRSVEELRGTGGTLASEPPGGLEDVPAQVAQDHVPYPCPAE